MVQVYLTRLNKSCFMELDEEILNCTRCQLSEKRTNAVPGAGDENANIMFVGEAPGRNEDEQGLPFVGRAGSVLDELLESIDFSREDVYITNVVKCRPSKNRDPTLKEIKACSPYLDQQIKEIDPRVLVPLGRFATEYLLEKYNLGNEKISRVHGKRFQVNRLSGSLSIIPMFHPAVVAYDPSKKDVLLEDFKELRDRG